jgi:hypothetical protein
VLTLLLKNFLPDEPKTYMLVISVR